MSSIETVDEICEWCGIEISKTGEQCPARDPGVGCDPDPY